jgi:lysophospholipase L1-like esterase
MPPTSLLFIGDSLTEWFDWQARFPCFSVTNLGVSGETVEGLLDRLDRVRQRAGRPDAIFLMTGINNIAMGRSDILPPYREVVSRLRRDIPKAAFVIQSVLPVTTPWIDRSVIPKINERLARLAAETGARYLDVHGKFLDPDGSPRPDYLLDDGVHLSDKGYAAWAETVEAFLKRPGIDKKS